MVATSLAYEVDTYSIAQSFYVSETSGIFVTKVQLYFQQTSDSASITEPVLLELRTMINGYPSQNVLPGSETVAIANNVNFTTNASTPTDFIFDEPVYLSPFTDYCFVVATTTSKYKLFAAQGDTFVIGSTEERISKQQTNGSLFFSQNSATFSPAQDTDLSFKLWQAKFNQVQGTVALKNAVLPQRLLSNDPISVDSGESKVTVYFPNHGFAPKDFVNIQTNLSGGNVGGLDSDNLSGYFQIDSADYTGFTFTSDSAATSSAIGGGDNILCDKQIPYNKVFPGIQNLVPKNTHINAGFKGVTGLNYNDGTYLSATSSGRYTQDTEFGFIAIGENNLTTSPYRILSSTVEDSAGLSGGSANMRISLSSVDSNVSPVIDLQRTSLTTISYQIDNQGTSFDTSIGVNEPLNYVAESNPSGGSAASKHITNVITLSEDAVGLKIILSANRPSQTSFEMWYRTATSDEVITDKSWVLQAEETNNPTDEDPSIFRDYEYLPGGLGGTLSPFTKFQLKIVMKSQVFAKAPSFQSLRTIAMAT